MAGVSRFAVEVLIGARDTLSSTLSRVTAGLLRVGAAAAGIATAVGLVGVGAWLAGAATAAEEADQAARVLAGTLDATGQAAGLNAAEVAALAQKIEGLVGLEAEQAMGAATALATFKGLSGEMYEQVILLAQGLEAAGLGQFSGNIIQLGKALEDPVKGLTALARSGVTFTEQQESVIKGLVLTGQTAKAQGIVLAAVAGQVSGVAEAANQGWSGARDRYAKSVDDLRKAVGAGLLPSLERATVGLTGFWSRLADTGVAQRFGAAVGSVFERLVSAGVGLVEGVDVEGWVRTIEGSGARLQEWASEAGARFDRLGEQWRSAMAVGDVAMRAASGGWSLFRSGVEAGGLALSAVAAPFTGASAVIVNGLNRLGMASDGAAKSARDVWEYNVDVARVASAQSVQHLGDAGRSWGLLGAAAQTTAPAVAGAGEAAAGAAADTAKLADSADQAAASHGALTAGARAARVAEEALARTLATEAAALDRQRVAGLQAADALKAVGSAAQALREAQATSAQQYASPLSEAQAAMLQASADLGAKRATQALGQIERGLKALNTAASAGDRSATLAAVEAQLRALAVRAAEATKQVRSVASGDATDKAGQAEIAKLTAGIKDAGEQAGDTAGAMVDAATRARQLGEAYQAAGLSAEQAARRLAEMERQAGAAPTARTPAAPRASAGDLLARYRAAGMSEAEARRRAAEDAGADRAAARAAEDQFRLDGSGPLADDPKPAAAGAAAGAADAGKTARQAVEQVFAAPIVLRFDVAKAAAEAAATVAEAITRALAGAHFSVPVTAIVTVDSGGATPGGADISREAVKRGQRFDS